jgi:TDG/mug DNA glycosylase family protein
MPEPVLPDVLQPGLQVVFCGTAAGAASARARAYYAGPGNAFWPTLHATGLTPVELPPHAFPTVTRYGIGLTDVAKRASGADATLTPTDFDAAALHAKIERARPRVLAFNGKRAAQVTLGRQSLDYGPQAERIGGARVVVLPSTSGAARRYWDVTYWYALAKDLSND